MPFERLIAYHRILRKPCLRRLRLNIWVVTDKYSRFPFYFPSANGKVNDDSFLVPLFLLF